MKKQYSRAEWAGLGLASMGAWLGGKNGLYISINKVRRNRHKVSERDLPDWQAELHMPSVMSFPVANAEDLIVGLREGARLFLVAAEEMAKDIGQCKTVPEKDRRWLEDNGFSMSSAGVFAQYIEGSKLVVRYSESTGWTATWSQPCPVQSLSSTFADARGDTAKDAVNELGKVTVDCVRDEQKRLDKGVALLKEIGDRLKDGSC